MFDALTNFTKQIFGDSNERELKKLQPTVEQINALEPRWKKLSDEELAGKTAEFKQKIENGASLDDILPEAFATVRETGRRLLSMRHYDCQLIGGMVLHQGKIAEMKTGEGKTLVATLPVYLNALSGDGAHVVTVNDYLAKRDAEWMSPLYNQLGMSVGVILSGERNDVIKRDAYACDVTYGTNNEFGFDYLRDNMKFRFEDMVQRKHNFAIVDEVDSILIDEARNAAHHQRAHERLGRPVQHHRLRDSAAAARGRLHGRREGQVRHAYRRGNLEDRAEAGDRQPLRSPQHGDLAPRQPVSEGALPLQARPRTTWFAAVRW